MKEYNADYDYTADLEEGDVKTDKGKDFVYLRGLEKLARARGVREKQVKVHCTPTADNMIAVVSVSYVFSDGARWESVADCTAKSAKEGFAKYLTAMAESRAKARALRDAFGISLCSVEEIAVAQQEVDEEEKSPPITDVQKHTINSFMKDKNKTMDDVRKLLELPKLDKLEDLDRVQAARLMRRLQGDRK